MLPASPTYFQIAIQYLPATARILQNEFRRALVESHENTQP